MLKEMFGRNVPAVVIIDADKIVRRPAVERFVIGIDQNHGNMGTVEHGSNLYVDIVVCRRELHRNEKYAGHPIFHESRDHFFYHVRRGIRVDR